MDLLHTINVFVCMYGTRVIIRRPSRMVSWSIDNLGMWLAVLVYFSIFIILREGVEFIIDPD